MKTSHFIILILILTGQLNVIAQEDLSWWQTEIPVTAYMAALDSCSEAAFSSEFEYPLLLVMDEREADKYKKVSAFRDKKDFIRRFLLGINQNPILPVNYWLMEFTERYKHVRAEFPSEKPPYFDVRGEYYLKYGKPRKRFVWKDKIYYNRSSRITRRYSKMIPNETWYYAGDQNLFNIHFMLDEEWKQVDRLRDIARRDLNTLTALILMREFTDPHYSYMADELRMIAEMNQDEKGIIREMAERNDAMLPYMKDHYQERLIDQLAWDLESLEHSYMSSAEVNVSTMLTQVSNLDFTAQTAQFRHSDGRTRINLTMYAPVQSLLDNINPRYMNLVKTWKNPANIDSLNVEFQFMVRDSMYTPMVMVPVRNCVSVTELNDADIPNILSLVSFPVSPTSGDLTLQVKDLDRLTYGYRKLPFEIKDYSGESLMVSDMQFLMEIPSSGMRKILPVQEISGLTLAPYPYLRIRQSVPLFCYFELYNVTNGISGPSYNIEILTKRVEKSILEKFGSKLLGKKGYEVGVKYNREKTDNHPSELIALDLSELKPGRYDISVSIVDPLSHGRSVNTVKRIEIIK